MDRPGVDNSPARYTKLFRGQEARRGDLFKRPFYIAGETIDGAVIQHLPGSEVMVVDFEKDKVLKKFYDSVISDYSGIQDPNKPSLPEYVQKRVEGVVVYNMEISDAFTDGTLQTLVSNPVWMSKLDSRIDKDTLIEISKWGTLENIKVDVGTYIKLRAGVCRQQGVIVAACMERAIRENRALGWKGVEIRGNFDIPGGHLWAVCLDDKGKEHVFDPANHYHGGPDGGNWNYRLGYENHTFGKPGS